LSPQGPQARLSTLIFHRVHARPDAMHPLEVDAERFDRLCGWIGRWFNVIALDDAVQALKQGTLPERALAITFDDGYADNHDVALPILQRHGMKATFFIATGYLDGGRMWNDTVIESIRATRLESVDLARLLGGDAPVLPLLTPADRRAAVSAVIGRSKYLPPVQRQAFVDEFARVLGASPPRDLMMTSTQVQALRRAGMQIGAHTVSHPILRVLDKPQALEEIAASRRFLQNLLDEPVGLFAYPNGKRDVDFDTGTAGLVEQLGFDAAVTTEAGVSAAGTDRFQLPRFTPWETDRGRFAWRLWQNLRRSKGVSS
jgi:peptidoglycan/xylan/chitin deacetylase (PgdA/CDA1 family)